MSKKCILIEMGKRKFFTHREHYNELIEFVKKFKAKMSLVKIISGPILSLDALSEAITDSKSPPKIEYEKVIPLD